jgi:hypothetical protein
MAFFVDIIIIIGLYCCINNINYGHGNAKQQQLQNFEEEKARSEKMPSLWTSKCRVQLLWGNLLWRFKMTLTKKIRKLFYKSYQITILIENQFILIFKVVSNFFAEVLWEMEKPSKSTQSTTQVAMSQKVNHMDYIAIFKIFNFSVKCRHCRLRKCIQIGMNRQLVHVIILVFLSKIKWIDRNSGEHRNMKVNTVQSEFFVVRVVFKFFYILSNRN